MIDPLVLRADEEVSWEHKHIVVSHTPFRIGRKHDNDARIPSSSVSAKHAVFSFEEGDWRIIDQKSTNGTYVNGRKVLSEVIHVGDIVHFGTNAYHVVRPSTESMENSRTSLGTILIESIDGLAGLMDLVNIIQEDRVYPLFQPIHDLVRNETVGWESLGRGASLNAGAMLNPALLFWLASKSNSETKLSHRFRESARGCLKCAACWPKYPEKLLFLNVHPAELRDKDILKVLSIFHQSLEDSHYKIVVEMPESWVCNNDDMQHFCNAVREQGMLVAYDDFGQGQARITDLINAPPDFLKIDRQLISSLNNNAPQQILVQGVVQACAELKVTVLAEGIETQEELEACVRMGITLGQGYHLGRPRAAYELFDIEPNLLPGPCPFVRLRGKV